MNKIIPEEYRNCLYAWEGGGYDGCIWEMNFGYVSDEGNWVPFHSTGIDRLDCNKWFDDKIEELKVNLGYPKYDNVGANYRSRLAAAETQALHEVYGEDIWANPRYAKDHHIVNLDSSQVKELVEKSTKKDTERYNEFITKFNELQAEKTNHDNQIFLDQIEAQKEVKGLDAVHNHSAYTSAGARTGWQCYKFDTEDNAKESCEELFTQYSGNPGLIACVLDKMAEAGYEVWGKCSDCGEMFQSYDVDSLSAMLDPEAYHGNGGIGCVYTRLMCDSCREETTCPHCLDPNLPNYRTGETYEDKYLWCNAFLGEWLGVCDTCSDNFFYDEEYKHWREEIENLGAAFTESDATEKRYFEAADLTSERKAEIKADIEKNKQKLKDELRERMREDVLEYFGDSINI